MAERLLYPNGVNGATGSYLQPPTPLSEAARLARGEPRDRVHLRELTIARLRRRAAQPQETLLRPREGIDPLKLDQAGWGVVFAADDPQADAIREALAPLLDLRRAQAGDRYREYHGGLGYRAGESKLDFLRRFGVAPGAVDPQKIPYYLLLIGDAERLPFRFQYQLDIQFAVGRLCFDTLDDYARYAAGVVAAETGTLALPRRALFFGARSPADEATFLSSTELVAPLAEAIATQHPDWRIDAPAPHEAKRARLAQVLRDGAPALLFTASHGMAFPTGDPRQAAHQGALLCSDWPGPLDWRQPIPPEFYFTADDVDDHAVVQGMVAFFFACFGAGTPQRSDFDHLAGVAVPLASHPFVARLPQRLLAHPRGAALAVIGHIDQAWGYSFQWEGAGRQLAVFESMVTRLLAGQPVGQAVEYLNERYAELSAELTALLQDERRGATVDDATLAGIWTATNDARSYVILGDPAARLALVAAPVAPQPASVAGRDTREIASESGAREAAPGAGRAAFTAIGATQPRDATGGMEGLTAPFRVAVVQDAPQAFDQGASLAKAMTLIADAAARGAQLVVFPEAFLCGYPKGLDFGARVGMRSSEGRDLFRRYFASALDVPGPATVALGEAARAAGVHLVIGVIERDGGTLYCTALFFGSDGALLGKHRKVMPTAMERLIWGFGDGSTLQVIPTSLGRLGAAICWENYMPQLRLALYGQGVQLYCAPTVDDRETWLPTMRHIALEGRCFVISACQFARRRDYPPDVMPIQGNDPETVLIRGGSCIIGPLGEVLAGPVFDAPVILTADIDPGAIARATFDLDVVGHYARPDIFRLSVNTRPAQAVRFDPPPDAP